MFRVVYYDKDTGDIDHIEEGYRTYEEANSDAQTYLYGWGYEIEEYENN